MGKVYEALDQERNATCALKTLSTLEPEAILRFKHEFRALADLHHPNLVSLGELHEEQGAWFFTMELVRGVDFLTWVRGGFPGAYDVTAVGNKARKRYDEARLRGALAQLASGLASLHAANKVHRDVKPSNVLVTADGRVVILDFGLVSEVDAAGDERVAGTLAFMAPEQASSGRVGPAADWYSVGGMLYLALTGLLTHDGLPDEVLEGKRTRLPTSPRKIDPAVPADLDALCMHMLAPDPAARPSSREVLERLHAPQTTVPATPRIFVGRRSELAALDEACQQAPGVVFVHGESGIGKTTLVQEFANRLRTREVNALVLTGRCSERESVPYKALDEIVDALSQGLVRMPESEIAELVPPDAWLLAEVFPVLGRIDQVASAKPELPDLRDPRERRAAVFGALRELLRRLGERRSVVLVIDDFQWADADSVSLIVEIVRPPDPPRLLLVANVRTSSENQAGPKPMAELARSVFRSARHLRVDRLPPDDTTTLVATLLEQSGAAGVDAANIAAESRGHPLFTDAIVRHRLERGEQAHAGRLDEALWARVERLSPPERRLVELVAIAGGRIAKSTAAQAVAMDLVEFEKLCNALRAQNLVRTDGRRDTDGIEPYHDRVREAVRARLSAPVREGWHGRLALALEASGRADAEALAVHWRAAGNFERAGQFATEAAEQAARALAFDRAVSLYRMALDIGVGDALRLREKLAFALVEAGRGGEAAEVYLDAARIAEPAFSLDLRRRAAEQLLRSGRIDRGVEELRRVLAADGWRLAKTPQRAMASLALRRAGIRLRGLGFQKRRADEVPPGELARIDTCWSVSVGLGMVDHLRGSDFQSRNLLLALRAGEPLRLSRALSIEACYAAASGPSGQKRAQRVIEVAARLADEIQHPHALAWVLTARGTAAFLEGRWKAGLEWCGQAETMYREQCPGSSWEIASMQLFQHQCLAYMGRFAELARVLPPRLRLAEQRGDLYAATTIRNWAFIPPLIDDDVPSARECATAAIRDWSQQGFYLQHVFDLSAWMEIDMYAGDAQSAYDRIRAAWPHLREALLLHVLQLELQMRYLFGRSAIQLFARTGAPSLLGEAERAARRMLRARQVYSVPMATMLLAGIACSRGQRERAIALCERAEQGCAANDMAMYAATMRRQRGVLTGDANLVAEADARMRAEGIRVPERIAALFAPGFVNAR
jgi:hypothetical protein